MLIYASLASDLFLIPPLDPSLYIPWPPLKVPLVATVATLVRYCPFVVLFWLSGVDPLLISSSTLAWLPVFKIELTLVILIVPSSAP